MKEVDIKTALGNEDVIDGKAVSEIGKGLLVLVAVEVGDTDQ